VLVGFNLDNAVKRDTGTSRHSEVGKGSSHDNYGRDDVVKSFGLLDVS